MAENKQSFVAYCEWMETFNKLTDEQAGVLIKHIFSYVNDQNPEPKDFIIDLAFTPIKQQLKRDLKKYESIVERNKVNGSKGGRPKKEETQKTQSVISDNVGNPKKPKKADNGNVNGNVDEKKKKKKYTVADFKKDLISLGVDEDVAEDWIKIRSKKGAQTQTAFKAIKSEIEKYRLPANECITEAVARSWTGFKAEWMKNDDRNKQTPTTVRSLPSSQDREPQFKQAAMERIKQNQGNG